jgi:hypothetical protein
MLSQVGEWYSSTSLKADDQKLIARRSAAEALAVQWSKPPTTAADLLNAVAYGLEVLSPIGPSANTAGAIVGAAITKEQPSFAPETDGGTLDPRLCALVALSELLSRRLARPGGWRRREFEVVAAEAIVAGCRFRQFQTGAFLSQRVTNVYALSASLLDKMDESRRQRRGDPTSLLNGLKTKTDVASVRDDLAAALTLLFADVQLDREEVQALWWVFGGVSQNTPVRFSELSPSEAATRAGLELASITHWPGTLGMAALAARVAAMPAGAEQPFDRASVSPESRSAVLASPRADQVRRWPAIFPLLATLVDGPGAQDGTAILKSDLTVSEAAMQMFTECSLLGIVA